METNPIANNNRASCSLVNGLSTFPAPFFVLVLLDALVPVPEPELAGVEGGVIPAVAQPNAALRSGHAILDSWFQGLRGTDHMFSTILQGSPRASTMSPTRPEVCSTRFCLL
jgi:hypothetical protein